jgi:hypothetical protein
MARFLYHTSCEKCGSSDAKGIYDDNSTYCFSCKYSSRIWGFGKPVQRRAGVLGSNSINTDSFSRDFSAGAVDWITKYITLEQALRHNVKYNPERDQVVFTWPETDFYQARNLNPESKVRYFTSGSHADILPIYYAKTSLESKEPGTIVVLVEDCLSSIKVAEAGIDSMPLLSSSITKKKLARLSRLYSYCTVWLDHDKGLDSIKIARQANLLGLTSKVVHTDLDPKCYTQEEIYDYAYS